MTSNTARLSAPWRRTPRIHRVFLIARKLKRARCKRAAGVYLHVIQPGETSDVAAGNFRSILLDVSLLLLRFINRFINRPETNMSHLVRLSEPSIDNWWVLSPSSVIHGRRQFSPTPHLANTEANIHHLRYCCRAGKIREHV